jgi:cytochrome c nitrite reductase small subunit
MRLTFLVVVLGIVIGAFVGIGSYTFIYAKGYSYFTNNPAACANCHAMDGFYASWMKSPHHAVAVCNDCHTPHDVVGKYAVKASNGFRHSFYFTSGRYPEALSITPMNRAVTESACRSCHREIVGAIEPHGGRIACIRCHAEVGHL